MPQTFDATQAGYTASVDFPTQAEIFAYIGYEMLEKLISAQIQLMVSTAGDDQHGSIQALKSLHLAVAIQEATELPLITITPA